MLIIPLALMMLACFLFKGEKDTRIMLYIIIAIWLTYALTASADMLGEAMGWWTTELHC